MPSLNYVPYPFIFYINSRVQLRKVIFNFNISLIWLSLKAVSVVVVASAADATQGTELLYSPFLILKNKLRGSMGSSKPSKDQ